MEGNGFVTREQLLARGRREVETTLGKVRVRALGYADISTAMGALLDVATMGDKGVEASPEERLKSFTETLKGPKGAPILGSVEKVILKGCVEPQLAADAKDGPAPSDFPLEDQMAIFTAICELSGYSKKDGEQVRP